MQILYGFLLAAIVAFIAHRAHSLDQSGAIAAVFVGTIIFGVGGWQWAVLLLAFFVTSSGLSRLFRKRKQSIDEKFSKGHRRDAGQVFGNGGLATLFVVLHALYPESSFPWIGFAACLAAVNADTWATELGVLNPAPPRMITNLRKRVEKGTSGGISAVGTLASFAGAGLIGLLAYLFEPVPNMYGASMLRDLWHEEYLLIITIAGVAGSLFDSFLGATVQAMYYCPTDQKETERHPTHTCGTPTVQIRGWKWLDNDWVNFASSAFGGLIAWLGFLL